MSKNDLTIAAIQMTSSANFAENLATAKKLILAAKKASAQMVVLPEYFAIMGLSEKDKFEYVEKHGHGPLQSMLSDLAKTEKLWIVAGTHPVHSNEVTRPLARCYVYNDCGEVVKYYDKIHLFDVAVEDNLGSYCESQYTKAGKQIAYFESPWGKIGIAVCYDLRFPELFRELSKKGCRIFVMPAAFTYQTGKLHWQTLIKARAIENLCYFVASAQSGTHQNTRETWGHSCIVSPWGEVLSELKTGIGHTVFELDSEKQSRLRKEFPVLSHIKL